MNYPAIFRLLGVILLTLTISFLVCLGVGLPYREAYTESGALPGFGISAVISAGMAFAFFYLGRHGDVRIYRKEALCVIGMGWIIASLIGAIPFFLILPDCSLADAVFESTSGITTTGASVFSDLERFPRSLMFWRCLSQWIGGLGIVVLFVALLSFIGGEGKKLFTAEASVSAADLTSERVQTGVMHIMWLYLGLSTACATTYRLCGMGWFDAICHMFTTVSTAGFSTRSASIEAFHSPLLEWMVVLFMVLAGTSFPVMLRVISRDWREVRANTEVKCYFLILIVAVLLLFVTLLAEPHRGGIHDVFRNSAFQVVSIMTTTGYSTVDFERWAPAAHAILISLMVIGGCSSSTAGGVKVIRVIVGLKVCRIEIEKSFRQRVVRAVKVNGRTLNDEAVKSVVLFLVLISNISFVSVLVVSHFEPHKSFEGVVSAMHSCLFNIGPGLAEVGPTRNYGDFHTVTKYYLSLLMIMGRLELYAVLALFAPSLWKRFS